MVEPLPFTVDLKYVKSSFVFSGKMLLSLPKNRSRPSVIRCIDLILNDVGEFLRRRGLEYFKGFSTDSSLPLLDKKSSLSTLAELGHSRCSICWILFRFNEVNGRMTEYGEKVGTALKAVVQLHTDTSKLLVDFEKEMPGYSSVLATLRLASFTLPCSSRGLDRIGRVPLLCESRKARTHRWNYGLLS